jgi:hypothetical protein
MPAMRTAGVKQLVEEALAMLPGPATEDVIDEVFAAIASRTDWRQRYDDLCSELGRTVVNTWGGYWIARAVGRVGDHQVPATSGLTESYSKLYPNGNDPHPRKPRRIAGLHPGAMTMADDFDAPLPDEFWVGRS